MLPPAVDPVVILLQLGPIGEPIARILHILLLPIDLILISLQFGLKTQQQFGVAFGETFAAIMYIALMITVIIAIVIVLILLLVFLGLTGIFASVTAYFWSRSA